MNSKIEEVSLDALIPDNLNANRGTEYGTHLLEKSFRELGAGRSILLDKNNRIIAGNKSTETAAAIGLKKLIIVDTDGTQLVAVRRTDIDLDSKQGRELAIADNATSKANLQWEPQVIAKIEEGWGVVPADWGIPDFDVPEQPEEPETPAEITLSVQSNDPVALRLLSVELQERGFKCNLKE